MIYGLEYYPRNTSHDEIEFNRLSRGFTMVHVKYMRLRGFKSVGATKTVTINFDKAIDLFGIMLMISPTFRNKHAIYLVLCAYED